MQEPLPSHPTDRRAMIAGIGGLAAGALFAAKANAGPLNPPPGPIAPTPGPEPRIAINSTNTPGDADSLFVIPAPGSYYLPQTLVGQPGKNGIRIAASHVTLDLNGFSVIGIPSARSAIIVTSGPPRDIAIRNGGVRSWPENGISLGFGAGARNLFLESLHIASIGLTGLTAPGLSIVRNCIVETCGSDGILAGSDSHISDCVLLSNQGRGIVAQDSTIITRCTIRENGGVAILVGNCCAISDCAVRASRSSAISILSGCTVTGNTLQDNQSGILALLHNKITHNTIVRTIPATGSFGIHVTSFNNQIESNNVVQHTPGIHLESPGNILVRNAVASTQAYLLNDNNAMGPIVSRFQLANNNNPNANYQY